VEKGVEVKKQQNNGNHSYTSPDPSLYRACWISLQIEPRCHRARKMVTSEISFRF
jgi:hypothetical protein